MRRKQAAGKQENEQTGGWIAGVLLSPVLVGACPPHAAKEYGKKNQKHPEI